MEEQLISFETAKLAKEKGYDFGYYWRTIEERHNNKECLVNYLHTQSLLQKWLREVHNIYIEVIASLDDNKIFYESWINVFKKGSFKEISLDVKMYSEKYEEALEIGLQEALKLI